MCPISELASHGDFDNVSTALGCVGRCEYLCISGVMTMMHGDNLCDCKTSLDDGHLL